MPDRRRTQWTVYRRAVIRGRLLLRNIFSRGDSPERVARGFAAGCFAAGIPLPGIQIGLSVIFAWIVRGNKAIAILPQFVSNPLTMLPQAYAQFRMGQYLWPGEPGDIEVAMAAVREANAAWSWSHPAESIGVMGAALAGLGENILGPLLLGVVITCTGAAMLAYPVGVIVLTWLYRLRMRARARKGVGAPPPHPLHIPPPNIDASWTEEECIRRYAIHPQTYVRAESIKLLVDGAQAFPEMLAAIAHAQRSVDLETYILRPDRTGRRFAAALIAARTRGVRTRLLFDGVGGLDVTQDYLDELLRAGVEVRIFRPLSALWRLGLDKMNRRDHRKILIADGRVAFTGGLNIADDYASKADGGGGWRDTHLRLDGPLPANELARLFAETWHRAEPCPCPPPPPDAGQVLKGSLGELPATPSPAPPPCDAPTSLNAAVQILSNKELLRRIRIRRAYLHAIRSARRYILIENAYFIPDRGIRRALYRAVHRGAHVSVVVAMHSDVAVAAKASRALYGELLANGVRLFEYPVSMLHSKVAVIDDVWSVVSSYNIDHRSLLHNLEAGALVIDRGLAGSLRDQILRDIAVSHEVSALEHQSRPWKEALASSFCYQFRYWL